MQYDTSLGVFGNLKKVISLATHTDNNYSLYKYENDFHTTTMEQQQTESYLDMVQAQQNITDLQIEIEELKRRN